MEKPVCIIAELSGVPRTAIVCQAPTPLASLRGAKGAGYCADGDRRSRIIAMILLLWTVLVPAALQATDVVSLALDRSEAMPSDPVGLTVTVEGGEAGQPPQIAGLEAFQVNTGGTSSQIQIINGSMRRSFQYTYYLQPTRTGVFTIGPARITLKGRTYASNTVQLTVSSQPEAASGTEKGPLFLTAALSSREAYLEQQLVYTLRLYRQTKVGDVSVDLPKVEGISFRQLGEPKEYIGTMNGQNYQVVEVSYLLTPTRPGTFALDPARMQMTVFEPSRHATRGFFSDPFFGASPGRPRTVSSEPLDLSVKPLPPAGRPADFTGLVGVFRMNARCDPLRLKAGDSAALTVQVTGQGNVNRIPDLSLPEIPGLKVYADKPQSESAIGAQGVTGTKTMKWAIVPQKQGTYEIPALTLAYFDTDTNEYRTLRTRPLTLNALGGEPQPAPPTPSAPGAGQTLPAKREVEALGKDILPIHIAVKDLHPGLDLHHSPVLALVALLVPPLAWLVVLIALRVMRQDVEQAQAVRAKGAAKAFASTFVTHTPTASQTLEAVRVYINDRFGLTIGLITPEEVRQILTAHELPPEIIDRLHTVVSILQQTVYTGSGDTPVAVAEDLSRLIRRIDKEVS